MSSHAASIAAATSPPSAAGGAAGPSVWIERLRLTNFRNYAELALNVGPGPVVLTGPNGAGKTNLLEAVSLLSAGQGLRRAPYAELARLGCSAWAVAGTLRTPRGAINLGTGFDNRDAGGRSG